MYHKPATIGEDIRTEDVTYVSGRDVGADFVML